MSTPRRLRPSAQHREVAREAGLGRISPVSVIAGTMCAYGTFAIVAAVVGALLSRTDVDTDFRTNDFTSSGAVAGLASALVLLAAYLFGGYVAGRMARRAGILHGILVFVLSLVVGAIVGGVAATAEGADVEENIRSIGVPTSWDQVEGVAIAAAIASLAAILIGSVLGGMLGERWHTKLARRVADPDYGPAADARRRAEREDEASVERRREDELVWTEAQQHDRARHDRARHDGHDADGDGAGGATRVDAAGEPQAVRDDHWLETRSDHDVVDIRDEAPTDPNGQPTVHSDREVPTGRHGR